MREWGKRESRGEGWYRDREGGEEGEDDKRERDWTEDCPGCPPAYNIEEECQCVTKRCEISFFLVDVEIASQAG